MQTISLHKIKGFNIVLPLVLTYTYINFDLFDETLNLNFFNVGILLLVLIGLTLSSLIVLLKVKKSTDDSFVLSPQYGSKYIFMWSVFIYILFINLSQNEHASTFVIPELAPPIISLFLMIAIIVVCLKYLLFNFLLYSAVISFLPIINEFNFVTEPIMYGAYVLMYTLATYILIELSKPNTKLLAKNENI